MESLEKGTGKCREGSSYTGLVSTAEARRSHVDPGYEEGKKCPRPIVKCGNSLIRDLNTSWPNQAGESVFMLAPISFSRVVRGPSARWDVPRVRYHVLCFDVSDSDSIPSILY